MIKYVAISITTFILFSCAPKIKTEVTFPARSAGATQVNMVAVLPFSGNNGSAFVGDTETVLKNIKVNGKDYFTLIDRHNINEVIQEQNFQMNVANENTIAELGKVIGAEGVYTGSVNTSSNDSAYTQSRSKCIRKDKKGKCKEYAQYKVSCTKRTVIFKFQPKLIDVATTQILFSQKYETQSISRRCSDSSYALTSRSSLINSAAIKAFSMFRKDIAPYTATVSIELMDDTDHLNKKEKEIFKGAIEFAKSGRMDRSCELWNSIDNSKSIDLYHNLGLCYEISGKLDDAEKKYRAADRLLIKPDDTINAALSRIVKMKEDQKKLQNQLH